MNYKKDWDTKKLKDPFEKKQYHELLYEVVLEARRLRSAWLALFAKEDNLIPDIAPKDFITKLLNKEIIDRDPDIRGFTNVAIPLRFDLTG